MKEHLLKKIEKRSIVVGVIGMGYVGLPLAVEKAKAGFKVTGFDVQQAKVDMINQGHNYIGDVVDSDLAELVKRGQFSATTDFSSLQEVDFVAICVPTPLDVHQSPDLSYVEASAKSVARYLHQGMIVVLESTTYPGTTEELVKPILEETGLKCGKDFYLGFSPERVDPGNAVYKTKNTPKVVGAIGEDAIEVIAAMYETVLQNEVFRCSSPAVAEMTKILENTYRNVNIALANSMAILCHRMGINYWEVIDAAKTKPFGFKAFYPGPGLGGHCIPLDPYYLSWKAREYGYHTSMIETSMTINDNMPEYCVYRVGEQLNRNFKKAVNGSKILVLGVAYKQDIDDYRESPAIKVIECLRKQGADVTFYDPYIQKFRDKGEVFEGEKELTAELLEQADAVIITTAHTSIDYDFVQQHAKAIFDTKNVTKDLQNKDKIELL